MLTSLIHSMQFSRGLPGIHDMFIIQRLTHSFTQIILLFRITSQSVWVGSIYQQVAFYNWLGSIHSLLPYSLKKDWIDGWNSST